jgi:hypothetical protein
MPEASPRGTREEDDEKVRLRLYVEARAMPELFYPIKNLL